MSEIAEKLKVAIAARYVIERELGQGGMATVYLAHDVKHDRKVALKVLRPELAAVLGAERFVQEIRTTAALNHPHILPLFDSGEAAGFLYYVMPYLQGETIRDRLNRETQLGIDEAARIATEVADALDYAHQQGVIHRDIKPENILLQGGRAMVADFGIALAVSAAAGGRMTETGLSLGTPHYMSPEQATADKALTARSDVYSLASVLFEMLTGNPPHVGSSAQQIIMRIVTEDAPPVTEARKSVPPNVAAAVGKALAKLPADRFDSARAFAEALADRNFSTAGMPGAVAPAATVGHWLRSPFSKVALGGVALLAVAAAWLASRAGQGERAPAREPVMAFLVMDSVPSFLQVTQANDGTIAFARDGQIFVRRPGEVAATAVTGIEEDAFAPQLSPDGADLVYMGSTAQGSTRRWMMRRASLRGGSSATLWTSPDDRTFAVPLLWSDDRWVYVRAGTPDSVGLGRLRDSGGEIERIVQMSGSFFLDAIALPGAKWIVGCVTSRSDAYHIIGVDVTTGDTTHVLDDACTPQWSPTGHLLVANSEGTVRAIPFDPRRLEVTGTPTPVLNDVVVRAGWAQYQLSPSGTLLYVAGPSSSREGAQLTFVDLQGRRSALPLPPTDHWDAAISPDGRMLAYTREDQIWTYDLNLGTHTRLTSTGSGHHNPVWSPDGTRVAYRATLEDHGDAVYVQALTGDSVVLVGDEPAGANPTQWLADGTILAFPDAPSDIVAFHADTTGPARKVLHADWNERVGRVSPDGKWLAFASDEAGRFQLMVRAWPSLDRKTVIADSTNPDGGLWSRDSRTLYYRRRSGGLMAATLAGTDSLRVMSQRLVVDSVTDPVAALHPDGKRFLVMLYPTSQADTSVRKLIAVTGWLTVLRERVTGSRQ